MARTEVDIHSTQGKNGNLLANIIIGDVRIETPETKQKLSSYNTILGLAPNELSSLLAVKFGKGTTALQSCVLDGIDKSNCDACTEVLLSPMQVVYIHAQ
eukprot:586029-Ditylum_brightwellii.AAC.1